MTEQTRWRIELLGRWGFSAKMIIQTVKKYDGEEYAPSTIYRTLHKAGVRLKDYRDGLSDESKQTIATFIPLKRMVE